MKGAGIGQISELPRIRHHEHHNRYFTSWPLAHLGQAKTRFAIQSGLDGPNLPLSSLLSPSV